MAAANQSYCEVQLDTEENYWGEFRVEQDFVQNSMTPNETGGYLIGQESPASVMLALQELGNRIFSTSEEMERRMADRFQVQIDRLNENVWQLDNAARVRSGGEPEVLWLAKWCKIHKVYIPSHSMLLLLFTNIFIHIQQLILL